MQDEGGPSMLPGAVGTSYAVRLGVALTLAVLVVVALGALISPQAAAELDVDVREDLAVASATQAEQSDDATEQQARAATDVTEMIDELTATSRETATQADTVANVAEDQSQSITRVAESVRDLRAQADELQSLLQRFDVEDERATRRVARD